MPSDLANRFLELSNFMDDSILAGIKEMKIVIRQSIDVKP